MRLTVIGCSPAWPNPGSAHSGYLVESPGHGRLLLDCGPGVLARLREHDLLPVDAVAITHFHLDHCGDLVAWAWFAASGLDGGLRPTLHLPPAGGEALLAITAVFGHETMFSAAFRLEEYEDGRAFPAAGFDVVPHAVEHYGLPAFGFRIRDGEGRVLGYSGDSAPCDGLRAVARETDLFLCEATLSRPEDDLPLRGHLAAEEALAAGAARVVVTHRPEEHGAPAGAEVARDGMVLEV